jgi:hypothetical protein
VTDYQALLVELAVPRLTGGASAERVRTVLKRELAARGFVAMEHRFVGRSPLYRWGRALLAGVNLIAVRPQARVATWLVAHYDSKGQPLSMAARLGAVALVGLGVVELLGLMVRGLLGPVRAGVPDALLGAAGGLGGLLLLGTSRATDRSAGAVDNGTGVVAVLATVDALPPGAGVGVIFPDAEEYGLLGSRALVRERAHLLANTSVLNFDGIDDRGPTIALVHRDGPMTERVVAGLGARRARWLPVLVDGSVLGRAARESVTVMRGDWQTLRTVHSRRDTAARLTLAGVATVARAVAAGLGRG